MSPPPCQICNSDDFRTLFEREGHIFSRCRTCALIRIEPQPSDDVLRRIYGSRYYEAWGVHHDFEQVMNLKKATFQKHVFPTVNLAKGARVLDCGAAFGTLMLAAREQGWEPYGIELSSDAAQKIGEQFGVDRIFSGPFEKAEFPGLGAETFAAVFMCDFIEHVRDPIAVLRKAASLLAPGGQLVITTPDGGSLSCRLMGASWPHFKLEHLFYFNHRNARGLLEQTGFNLRKASAAWKVLNFDYIRHQFARYPRAVITTLLNAGSRMMSPAARRRPVSFSLGEMIVTGQKA